MRKRKISKRTLAERAFIEKKLGDSVICDRCRCSLATFFTCPAELTDRCPGFCAIEGARMEFAMNLARGPR